MTKGDANRLRPPLEGKSAQIEELRTAIANCAKSEYPVIAHDKRRCKQTAPAARGQVRSD